MNNLVALERNEEKILCVKVKVDEDFYYIPITIFAQYAIKE